MQKLIIRTILLSFVLAVIFAGSLTRFQFGHVTYASVQLYGEPSKSYLTSSVTFILVATSLFSVFLIMVQVISRKRKIEKEQPAPSSGRGAGRHLYGKGWWGLFPLVGAFVGIWLAVVGITRYKDRNLLFIGLAGIVWTVAIYGSMFYFTYYSQTGKKVMANVSKSSLNDLVKELEFYKLSKGYYPKQLEELQAEDQSTFIFDPSYRKAKRPFQYGRVNDGYTLYSCGIDDLYNTSDDVYPDITDKERNTGFVKAIIP